MKGRMKEWVNEWMKEWLNGWMKELINNRLRWWIDEWRNQSINWIYLQVAGFLCLSIYLFIYTICVCIYLSFYLCIQLYISIKKLSVYLSIHLSTCFIHLLSSIIRNVPELHTAYSRIYVLNTIFYNTKKKWKTCFWSFRITYNLAPSQWIVKISIAKVPLVERIAVLTPTTLPWRKLPPGDGIKHDQTLSGWSLPGYPLGNQHIPPWEKGKSSSILAFSGDMLVPRKLDCST